MKNYSIRVMYFSPRTKTYNYNHAHTFDDAFAYYCDERKNPDDYKLIEIDIDLYHIVNAKNRVVCELHRIVDIDKIPTFRGNAIIERKL